MGMTWLPMNYNPPKKAKKPMKIYVVTDNHLGYGDNYINEFVSFANDSDADFVLHLGDVIHSAKLESSTDDPEGLSKEEADKWYGKWKKLNKQNEIILGNRDVDTNYYPLGEDFWISQFGWEDREEKGGTKTQKSLVIDNGDVKALFILLSSYSANQDVSGTINWVEREINDFNGNIVVVADHFKQRYKSIQDLLIKNNVHTPCVFLHGHNHPDDTISRDTWGDEIGKFDFPALCITNLYSDGNAVSLELHKGGFKEYPIEHALNGFHVIRKLDIKNNEIKEPIYHYQTRA